MAKKGKSPRRDRTPVAAAKPALGTEAVLTTSGPQFGERQTSPDPTKFVVMHGSDKQAYSILDRTRKTLKPLPFPVVAGVVEPVLTLADALGQQGKDIVAQIERAGRIVFHALGDSGNTGGPKDEDLVTDKLVSDYQDVDPKEVPSFLYHFGDVVYSFGEAQYYYDQFYDPYRDYPAPIFAIPGNHDGMQSPLSATPPLQAFLENFCAAGQPPHRSSEAGDLARTVQVQPGVYFTLEAPFARILGLYSNCLEDPGVISDQGGTYPGLGQAQVEFLTAAMKRVKTDAFKGAVIIAVHHPPYVAQRQTTARSSKPAGRHGGSPLMLTDVDAACEAAGVWPHAVLSGHAHNQQRFTRYKDGRETPFVVCGNGGHGLTRLSHQGTPAIRVPVTQPTLSDGKDSVVFESYDDQNYGYLRIVVTGNQLRIEYHPASDGASTKAPDDFVTVDIASHKLVHFRTP